MRRREPPIPFQPVLPVFEVRNAFVQFVHEAHLTFNAPDGKQGLFFKALHGHLQGLKMAPACAGAVVSD